MPAKAAPTQSEAWIPQAKIAEHVQPEPALLIIGLAIIAGGIYQLFLRKISKERHLALLAQFKNLGIHLGFASLFYLSYQALGHIEGESIALGRFQGYIGLVTLVWGALVFVKIARILMFEYMYLSHMRVAFPLLVVNLFSLLLSMGIASWMAAEIFSVRIAPLLATSAILSLVLGLALQDTIGNLFAGIALQFDKPYEIGDWIEVQSSGSQKWVGQVQEISWRATLLVAATEELVTIPNRVLAQSQISNFAAKRNPIVRSQLFRIPYGAFEANDELVRRTLVQAVLNQPGIRLDPAPLVYLSESTESWMAYKVIYFINDYGAQWRIADRVLTSCLRDLERVGITVAGPRLKIQHGPSP